MSTPFIYNPQRDAWKAIRGFCYQVELTVIRWLELQSGTVLHCECGEDIDHVRELLDADGAISARLLEQIKTKDKITLRSQEVLTALARFHDSVVQNPSLHVLYRFSTTAAPGREQGVRFPRNLPGIAAWNSIREATFDIDEIQKFVSVFKYLVASSSSPQDLPEVVFLQFQDYVASAEPTVLINEFIRRVEWATDLPNPRGLRAEIESLLLRQARAHIQEEAKLLTDILIVHVFELLTQRGEKRLTVEELERRLRERSITELDRRMLTRLLRFVEQAEESLASLTSGIESVSQSTAHIPAMAQDTARIPQLEDMLRSLLQQVSGFQGQLIPVRLPSPDEPPPIPLAVFAKRVELVQMLHQKLSGGTWLNITGLTGLGKTYIARLVAERHGLDRTAWISLRAEQTSDGLLRHLEGHLLRLASLPDRPELIQTYYSGMLPFSNLAQLVASRLTSQGLLVIHELPDLFKVPQLGDKVTELTRALRDTGGRLLTTGQRGIPQSIAQRLESFGSEIIEHPIPSMAQQDIEEMLTTAGAPPTLHHPGYIDLIYAATHGHPSLISATVSYLRRNGWNVERDQIISILTGTTTREVLEDTRRSLRQLLPDANARDLLDRLSLIGGPFDTALVRTVAEVTPSIPRPVELFGEIVGPWVHQVDADRFEVSPLLRNAGQAMLDAPLQERIHLALALHLFKGRTIDPQQASQIIVHLLLARSWHILAGFLLQLAYELREKHHAQAFEFIASLFTSSLPPEMPLQVRIALRAFQSRIFALLGEETQVFVDDLEAMIQQEGSSASLEAFLALLLIGPLNSAADATTAARRTLRACRIYRRLPSEIPRFPFQVPLETLMWVGLQHLQTQADVRGVVAVLADMTEEERKAAFAFEMCDDALQLLVDCCWMIEVMKAEGEQDWDGVLVLLDEIFLIAQRPGGESLLAPVVRARAIVLADYMHRPQEALDALAQVSQAADNNTRFLLHYTAASILLDHGPPEIALERFCQALAEFPRAYVFLHFDALRRAAEAAGRTDQWQSARDLAIRSLKLSRKADLFYERLEMIGELAWTHWSLGNPIKACAAMSGLVRGLLQRQEFENSRFQEVFRKTGHLLGWMASTAHSGISPVFNLAGQPYATPFPGLCSRARPCLSDIPFPQLVDLLCYQVGMFAAVSGLYELAWRSINQGKQLAQSQSSLSRVAYDFIDLQLAGFAARKEDYREAFDLTMSGIRALPVAQRLRELGSDALTSQISVEDIWTGLPGEERQKLESMLYWTTIGLAITGLLAKNANATAYTMVITELETIFGQSEHVPANLQYWRHMLRELRIAFSPLATRETIHEQIRNLPETEPLLCLLLYIALSHVPNATLRECCEAQASAFSFLLRQNPDSELMTEDIAIYLLRYWRRVAATCAFARYTPPAFRKVVRAIQWPTFSNIASLLLLASHITGAQYNDSVRQILIDATAHSAT